MSAYLELIIALIGIIFLYSFIKIRSVLQGFLISFILSLFLRWWLIWFTPELNTHIDLLMYMDGGQLTALGINPYNYEDSKEIRQQLRLDGYAYQEYTAFDQQIWNYCAASHLPLTQLNLAIAYLLLETPQGFRYYFAFFDAILCGLIFLYININWNFSEELNKYGSLVLGICSPFLISWGIVNPGDKGIETMFIVLLFLLINLKNRTAYLYLGAIVFGLAVAYKAVAVLIAPCIMHKLWSVRISYYSFIKELVIFGILSASILILSFLPFIPEVFYPMTERLKHGSVSAIPMHSSIWQVFYVTIPNHWKSIQIFFSGLILLLSCVNLLIRKTSTELFSINLLWIFVVLFLTTSGVDRMNMAFIPAVLVIGKHLRSNYLLLILLLYTITGTIILFYPLVKNVLSLDGILGDINFIESLACLLLTIVYFYIVFNYQCLINQSTHAPKSGRSY